MLTTRRLAAIASFLIDEPEALQGLELVLDDARAEECGIEIARCLHALRTCSSAVPDDWAMEEAAWRSTLGVVWMPPITFAERGDAPT